MQRPGRRKTVAAVELCQAGADGPVRIISEAYQLWDAAQGLASYVRANLAYKATLEGLGVGDVEASAMAGALATVYKDASSVVAGVLLAYGSGRDFGRRVRQWRLLADVANDAGLALQMAAPFYGDHFVPLACLAAACHCAYLSLIHI